MKKLVNSLVLVVCLIGLVGCTGPRSTEMVSRLSSWAITSTSLEQSRVSERYLQEVARTICYASSGGTNVSAEQLLADLDQIPATDIEEVMVNSLLSVWLTYQPDDSNRAPTLRGVCSGMELGLYSYVAQIPKTKIPLVKSKIKVGR